MQTNKFIRALWPTSPEGFLYTFVLPAETSTWYDNKDVDQLVSDVKENSGQDIYIGLCPSATLKTSRQRASRSDVCALPAIAVDIDIKGDQAHSETKLPESKEQALEWINGLSLPKPSMIVHTGNGLHVYWLLDTPFLITDDASRDRAEKLTRGINKFIIREGKKSGYSFDNVGDLARIFRVPGTYNHKSSPPKPVNLREHSGERYSFEKLSSYLPVDREGGVSAIGVGCFDQEYKKSDVKPKFKSILAGCKFIKNCVDDAETLSEQWWYRMLSIVALCEGGEVLCHQISQPHPKYSKEETDGKIDQSLRASGPATCAYIAETLGFESCLSCPLYYSEKIKSPISLGYVEAPLANLLGNYAYCISTQQFCEVPA
ncbi:MAG: hypothetical protein COA47_14485 [Robiginitomaculum sp.]|nr:MAG: hypothetical protein COA47_14485 [Robiginitomaculum sp.]